MLLDLEAERQLVEDAKNTSDAFGKLYDYYFPKVYAFVAAKVTSQDDAEDLTSDIFMKILENIQRFEWRGLPFGAWVFRIARNVLNDFYLRHKKHQTSDLEKAYDVSDHEEKTSPHLKASHSELSEKIQRLMRTLPERDASVLQLKFFSGLNNREIMGVLGLSESNVAIIIYRNLKKMKPDLQYFA